MLRGTGITAGKRLLSTAQKLPTFNVAIVGSGPAGFYTAHQLLGKSLPRDRFNLNVDIFEKNPVPYGLSRYGVAPDHPEVKNCEEYLDHLMDNKENESSFVRFFGNVEIGNDISLKELQKRYHSVVLAYGCTSSDNKLNVPGSDLRNVISARQFVNWYNGHYDYHSELPDIINKAGFTPPNFEKIENVTIIGNGNVALDVARVLLINPDSHWQSTDISVSALNALRKSSIKNVNIVARRGVLQSAFSNKEIRELLELSNKEGSGISFTPLDQELFEDISIKSLGRVDKRKVQLLEKYSKIYSDKTKSTEDTLWSLRYLLSPIEMSGASGEVKQTKFSVNKLIKDDKTQIVKVKPTEETEIVKNELVILSIGYQGTPMEEFEELNISFQGNKIVNKDGRILRPDSEVTVPGWYTSGWIKNGPQGVIATTMMDSFDTGNSILQDLSNKITTVGTESTKDRIDPNEMNEDLIVVTWDGWKEIDAHERNIGKDLGRERTKLESKEEMLNIATK